MTARYARPSVAVLVELVRGPDAGGHVKCWERFAEAAAGMAPPDLRADLTLYVLGPRERVERLSPAVRFVSLPPVLSTAPLMRVSGGADVSDLTPFHPRLARLLPGHDVWHLTHVFGFAATAVRLAQARRRSDRLGRTPGRAAPPGLVGSVHTDVPALAAAYLHALTGPYRLPGTVAAGLVRHRRDRLLHACDRVLVATPEQRGEIAAAVPGHRVGLLDRGVDHERFRPDPEARRVLAERYGVPEDRPAVLFSGRVDASKRVLVLADALRRLRADGTPVHLVVAGTGPDEAVLRDLLGPDVSLLGPVAQRELARVYGGCDVFAFPSRSETVGNAVGEAMASHLPVLLPAGARTTRWLARPGEDGVVVAADDAPGWAEALRPLLERPELRAALGEAAGATARGRHRSWRRVLAEDLLPVWHAVAPHDADEAGGTGRC
ncbi:glycosyltransferase [Streptomyces sp. RKND-216]|uniref:glycosyltransferase n=1 Tax=Streptomyces sp. RKND-216 TaxID=2562581 RepID=UPI00109D9A14|nr:glycosyltransferase [Streptomyces sp. RKND-216]THA26373.1 glycosyltransferase [Streptomyces sp. RKND-216]